ncbi:DUF2058 domain-containing protein [Lysobacter niabensis]|uniref:DUF2058 domain-containing protein n=1 Tax=Agrilutibacter niabensis TaxID=380628 RepID=UPI003609DAEF
MSDTLRDQLLGLGFKPAPKPERPAGNKSAPQGKPHGQGRPHPHGKPPQARQGEPASGRPQQRPSHKPGGPKSGVKPGPRTREEIDLAKAYALRAQREKDERIAAEAAKQEEARRRREARAKLTELVKDKGLNAADADIARHFPYGDKIKRIYVTADQLKALNAGELGVLQLDGRYVLVSADLVAQAAEIFPAAIALKVDPNAPAQDDPYADPKFQVPDDLVW